MGVEKRWWCVDYEERDCEIGDVWILKVSGMREIQVNCSINGF